MTKLRVVAGTDVAPPEHPVTRPLHRDRVDELLEPIQPLFDRYLEARREYNEAMAAVAKQTRCGVRVLHIGWRREGASSGSSRTTGLV